jgi:hypothetical protein
MPLFLSVFSEVRPTLSWRKIGSIDSLAEAMEDGATERAFARPLVAALCISLIRLQWPCDVLMSYYTCKHEDPVCKDTRPSFFPIIALNLHILGSKARGKRTAQNFNAGMLASKTSWYTSTFYNIPSLF